MKTVQLEPKFLDSPCNIQQTSSAWGFKPFWKWHRKYWRSKFCSAGKLEIFELEQQQTSSFRSFFLCWCLKDKTWRSWFLIQLHHGALSNQFAVSSDYFMNIWFNEVLKKIRFKCSWTLKFIYLQSFMNYHKVFIYSLFALRGSSSSPNIASTNSEGKKWIGFRLNCLKLVKSVRKSSLKFWQELSCFKSSLIFFENFSLFFHELSSFPKSLNLL